MRLPCLADVEYDSEETMKYEARKKIKTAADGSLNVDYTQDQAFITNSRASPFAVAWAKQEEMDARFRSLKYELDVVKEEHDGLKEEEIRHRFMSCIKRDVLHAPSRQDYYHINNGNGYAHYGNCVRDAHLYGCSGGRTDFSAYEKIYGLSPAVLRLEVDRKFLLFHMRMKVIIEQRLVMLSHS